MRRKLTGKERPMSTVELDQVTAEKLLACRELTLVRGPGGAIIGLFEPQEVLVTDQGVVPEFDEAELDRREQRWEGIPSAEVRKRLEQLR
jgi:hypothetical protein